MTERQPPRVIPTGHYPQLVTKARLSRAAFELRSARLRRQADQILTANTEIMRQAVLRCADVLERASDQDDLGVIYQQAHEIRGMAGHAGLGPIGHIADSLCRYIDTAEQEGRDPRGALVRQHVEAIRREALHGEVDLPDQAKNSPAHADIDSSGQIKNA